MRNKLACVVLNYNDEDTTISLIKKIRSFAVLDYIIVVDNLSPNGGYAKLKHFEVGKVHVIQSDKNGGYGYGNNVGINYAVELGAKYALISNPDVEFEESAVKRCKDIIEAHNDCAAVAPRMKGGTAWRIAPAYKDITYTSLVLNKIVKPRYYPERYIEDHTIDDYVYVDALPGSLVMIDIGKFQAVGMYDENVFLYHEEVIIGSKFKNKGYKTILYIGEEYLHHHGVTVSKTYQNTLKPVKIGRTSQRYYLKKYLKASRITMCLFYLLWPFECLEALIWSKIKRRKL